MKKIGILVLSAIIGSAFTLFGFLFFSKNNSETINIKHQNEVESSAVAFNSNSSGMLPDFTMAAAKVMPSTVHIKSTQTIARAQQPQAFEYYFGDDFFDQFFGPQIQPRNKKPDVRVGTGSGVIIKENGYIVTNNHVIENADDVEVTLNDNRTFKAKVVGIDHSTDLALLKIEEDELPYVNFSNSDAVMVGEWVLAVGNPFNLNSTVTAGIVSAKARNINIVKDKYAIESFIQTDAAINPGNSGGALVNLSGELVGINTAIASPTGAYSGYGFAIPSNIVKKVIEDLEEFGTVQRGYIGAMIRSVDASIVDDKKLSTSEGVFIDSLFEDGAASKAGIKTGDVIVEANGNKVKSSPELQEVIGSHKPGDVIDIKVNRSGEEKNFKVTLEASSSVKNVAKNNEMLKDLGVELKDIEAKKLQAMNLKHGVEISKIFAGKINKYTDIKPGFIVTKIDNIPVNSSEEFLDILRKKSGGVLLEGIYPNSRRLYYYAFGL